MVSVEMLMRDIDEVFDGVERISKRNYENTIAFYPENWNHFRSRMKELVAKHIEGEDE